MDLVKNTRQQVPALMVEDMNWDKRDAPNVNYSSIGKACGVLVVDVYLEQNLEQKN